MSEMYVWIRVCAYHKSKVAHEKEEEKGPTTVLCQVNGCENRASHDIAAVLTETPNPKGGE